MINPQLILFCQQFQGVEREVLDCGLHLLSWPRLTGAKWSSDWLKVLFSFVFQHEELQSSSTPEQAAVGGSWTDF